MATTVTHVHTLHLQIFWLAIFAKKRENTDVTNYMNYGYIPFKCPSMPMTQQAQHQDTQTGRPNGHRAAVYYMNYTCGLHPKTSQTVCCENCTQNYSKQQIVTSFLLEIFLWETGFTVNFVLSLLSVHITHFITVQPVHATDGWFLRVNEKEVLLSKSF